MHARFPRPRKCPFRGTSFRLACCRSDRWFERDGILHPAPGISFTSDRLRTGLEVVANKLGKKLDEDNPVLNAQLPDGSRLAAVIPPVVRPAPALVIRKFSSRKFTVEDLIERGTLS